MLELSSRAAEELRIAMPVPSANRDRNANSTYVKGIRRAPRLPALLGVTFFNRQLAGVRFSYPRSGPNKHYCPGDCNQSDHYQ